jgi:hypothetical protein
MIFCNIAVKVCKFVGFFLLKLLDSVDEVVVGFFFGVSLFGFSWVENNNNKFIKK